MNASPSRNTSRFKSALAVLQQHYNATNQLHMRQLFAEDEKRFERFSLGFDGLLLDYSKNRITAETMGLLHDLARAAELEKGRDAMFSGEKINFTEDRAVLHIALRAPGTENIVVDRENVVPEVHRVLDHMARFSEQVRSGEWTGYTGNTITDVVNIGIGGSDLGPKMVCESLNPHHARHMNFHFVSNVDGTQIESVLQGLDPSTTLFIIVSKTFTTQETITNANTARQWFLDNAQSDTHIAKHFVAVSTNREKVEAFGISSDNMFGFWDWVGGRYSLWSAVGLSIMLAIGVESHRLLLAGANTMDRHFRDAPLEQNMPVILALIGYWYRQFFNSGSHAVLPYDYLLKYLPSYLQQADMESNGKSTDREGNRVDYQTASVLWGESGINGQHSFYQLLHQGTQFVPVDFIASINTHSALKEHHNIMISNTFAQGEALMRGRNEAETREILEQRHDNSELVELLLPHMVFEGNRPSNTLLLDEITPYRLGMLIALYEHRIFVEGILWNINSYDQWGVELGKQLAGKILPQLSADESISDHDPSTNGLINHYRQLLDQH